MTLPVFHGVLIEAHKATKISPDDILGMSRKGPIVKLRQAIQYVMSERTAWSTPMIGKSFGRDHSTVIHARRAVADRLNNDPDVRTLVGRLMQAPMVPFDEYDRYLARLRDPKATHPVRRLLMLKPVARKEVAPAVAPAPAKWLDGVQRSRLKYFTSVDDEGHCYGERFMAFDMRRGSEKLRRAIVLARAA